MSCVLLFIIHATVLILISVALESIREGRREGQRVRIIQSFIVRHHTAVASCVSSLYMYRSYNNNNNNVTSLTQLKETSSLFHGALCVNCSDGADEQILV